jgi:RHS repeat-associated protein
MVFSASAITRGLNGVGGLDAVFTLGGASSTSPTISDYRGNILGQVTNSTVVWNSSRPTGYGAVPGYRPVALGHGANVAQSSAWRGRWVDITGYYQIGMRLYDPVAGMWLSYDSAWNERDPNYLTFAGGDPIMGFDPDGRCVEGTANYLYNGGAAGTALRDIGGYLDSYNNNSAGGGYLTGAAGTIVDELAGMSAPSTYVNGLASYGNNVSMVYNDSGVLAASSYAATSWNVGAVWSGMANIDLATGEAVGDWYQRGAEISSGIASTAGVAAGGVSLLDWATAPAATAPAVADTTSFYRVVSQSENQSLMESGEFTAPPSGGSTPIPGQPGKWFWGSQQEAEQFAPGWYGNEPYNIIETKIPNTTAPASVQPGIDNVGTGYFFKLQDLQGVPINTIK